MADKKKNSAADEAAKKALETAKKTASKKVTKDDEEGSKSSRITQEEFLAATKKNAMPYRIVAVILWLLAIGFEVMTILIFTLKVQFSFTVENPGWTISWLVCLGLDLICVVIGSLLWKKGNHLDPGSSRNKVGFWLRNNLGVIMAAIAFIPFIIFALTDKKAAKQSKIIAVIAAAAGLLIATLFGIDWNPVSQEQVLESAGLGQENVYWTASGTVYHAYRGCRYIKDKPDSDVIPGNSADSGKMRLCKICEEMAEAAPVSADADKTEVTNGADVTEAEKSNDDLTIETVEETQPELDSAA